MPKPLELFRENFPQTDLQDISVKDLGTIEDKIVTTCLPIYSGQKNTQELYLNTWAQREPLVSVIKGVGYIGTIGEVTISEQPDYLCNLATSGLKGASRIATRDWAEEHVLGLLMTAPILGIRSHGYIQRPVWYVQSKQNRAATYGVLWRCYSGNDRGDNNIEQVNSTLGKSITRPDRSDTPVGGSYVNGRRR